MLHIVSLNPVIELLPSVWVMPSCLAFQCCFAVIVPVAGHKVNVACWLAAYEKLKSWVLFDNMGVFLPVKNHWGVFVWHYKVCIPFPGKRLVLPSPILSNIQILVLEWSWYSVCVGVTLLSEPQNHANIAHRVAIFISCISYLPRKRELGHRKELELIFVELSEVSFFHSLQRKVLSFLPLYTLHMSGVPDVRRVISALACTDWLSPSALHGWPTALCLEFYSYADAVLDRSGSGFYGLYYNHDNLS